MPTNAQRAYANHARLARMCNRIARGVSFAAEEIGEFVWMIRVGVALMRDNRDGDGR